MNMFDFEKLEVYNEARQMNKKVFNTVILPGTGDSYLLDQLKRAQVSILLNISEGTGRMTKPDKKRFYVMARSSVNEVVSLLQVMMDLDALKQETYDDIYGQAEKVSKMMLGMIRSMTTHID